MVWFNLKKLNFGYVECNGCTESMPVWVRDDRYMEYVALKRQFQWRDKNTKKNENSNTFGGFPIELNIFFSLAHIYR